MTHSHVHGRPMIHGAVALILFMGAHSIWAQETDRTDNKAWGVPVEGQSVSISCDETSFAPEERIVLKVAFKNVGAGNVEVMVTNPLLASYELTVQRPDGTPLPWTLYGERLLKTRGMFVSRYDRVLKPGEEDRVQFPLSRMVDLSLAGTYTVSVARRGLWKEGHYAGKLKAISNTLAITIDESLDRESDRDQAEAAPKEAAKKKSE